MSHLVAIVTKLKLCQPPLYIMHIVHWACIYLRLHTNQLIRPNSSLR